MGRTERYGESKPAWFIRCSDEITNDWRFKNGMTPELNSQFVFPIYFDLGATFLYALTGALAAIRRHYDIVGLFVLALVSGVGGGLIRDSVFIEDGPPLAVRDERYLYAVIAGCLAAALFSHRMDRLQKGFLLADALGLGAYAVVGVSRALSAGLPELTAITVGVANASGGGLLRDILVRDEPLVLKPGQFYVLAALLGAGVFTLLVVHFARPVEASGMVAVACTFVFRLLAITFNWKTGSVRKPVIPSAPESTAPQGSPPPPGKEHPTSDGHQEKK